LERWLQATFYSLLGVSGNGEAAVRIYIVESIDFLLPFGSFWEASS